MEYPLSAIKTSMDFDGQQLLMVHASRRKCRDIPWKFMEVHVTFVTCSGEVPLTYSYFSGTATRRVRVSKHPFLFLDDSTFYKPDAQNIPRSSAWEFSAENAHHENPRNSLHSLPF